MTEPDDATPDVLGDASAGELVEEMKTASLDRAREVQEAELAKDQPRVTVTRAAQARLDVLELPVEVNGTVLEDGPPEGAWAQLLDRDGEPVQVDGNPVATELVE